ncbi:TY-Chap domain-containing protein [Dietzia sp. NPDC055340]
MTDDTGVSDRPNADWKRFTDYLTTRIDELKPGAVYTVELTDMGTDGAPFVQVVKSIDGDQVGAEVSSNQYLSGSHKLTSDQEQSLLQVGWFAPTAPADPDGSPHFHAVVDITFAAEMAEVITTTFQKVFGIHHPSELFEDADLDAEEGTISPGDSDERQISGAWEEFGDGFVGRILSLDDDTYISLCIDNSLGDASPFINAFVIDKGETVRVEVSSNQELPATSRLSAIQIGDLLALGWNPPSAPGETPSIQNFYVSAPVDAIDAVAVLVVDTLRRVFGIPHPSFLKPAPVEDELHAPPPSADPHEDEELLPIDQPYVAGTLEELQWAVSHVLRNMYGMYVPPDDDGVFPIRAGSAGLLIQVREPMAVSVTAFAVTKMRHPERASEILRVLNSWSLYVRFHIHDDDVMATCDFPAKPFVPAHLIDVIVTASRIIDESDEEIASRTGGTVLFGGSTDGDDNVEPAEDESGDDDLPDELLALIHMDNEPDVVVDPELAARLMRRDRSLILTCIRLSEEQAISWHQSAEGEEDEETAQVCRGEFAAWEALSSLLRRALPFTIE